MSKRIKIVSLGMTGVGKSTILHQYCTDEYVDNFEPTIGVSFISKYRNINEINYKLDFWDTAGKERYESLCPMYYKSSDIVIIVYSVLSKKSFDKAKHWIKTIKHELNEPTIILLGNKIDLKDRFVSKEDGVMLAQTNGIYFLEVSAKNNINIKNSIDYVICRYITKGYINPVEFNLNIEINETSCCFNL